MEEKVIFSDADGNKICGILSSKTGESTEFITIFSHGFSSHKNTASWGDLAKRLNEEGIAVLKIDLYAHGESEGKFEELTITKAVESISAAIRYVKEQGYQKIGLLGSSFGGIASLMAAVSCKDILFLGLKSPVSDYVEVLTGKLGVQGIKKWQTEGFTYIQDQGKNYKLNYTLYKDALCNVAYEKATSLHIPVQIVHGDTDSCVPIAQSRKLVKLLSQGNLHEVKGADHWYKNPGEREELVQTIFNFIKMVRNSFRS